MCSALPAVLPRPTAGHSRPWHAATRVLGSGEPPAPVPAARAAGLGSPLWTSRTPQGSQPGWRMGFPRPHMELCRDGEAKPRTGGQTRHVPLQERGLSPIKQPPSHKSPQALVSYWVCPMRRPLLWVKAWLEGKLPRLPLKNGSQALGGRPGL